MNKQTEIPERLIIRNATFTINDLFYLGLMGACIYFIFEKGSGNSAFVWVFVALLLYTAWGIFKRLRDRSDKLIIDKAGILVCEQNEFIPWSGINYAYIKKEVEGSGKNSKVVNYFHVDAKGKDFVVNMNNFSYNENLLVRTVEHFSGRNIGELEDKVNDQAKKMLGNTYDVDELSAVFKSFFRRQKVIGLLVFFIPMGSAFYLQFQTHFAYCIAIGLTVTILGIFLVEKLETDRLHNHQSLRGLDNDRFKEICREYAPLYNEDMSESRRKLNMIIVCVFGVAAYVITYFVSK